MKINDTICILCKEITSTISNNCGCLSCDLKFKHSVIICNSCIDKSVPSHIPKEQFTKYMLEKYVIKGEN